jgi:hypothetical protein
MDFRKEIKGVCDELGRLLAYSNHAMHGLWSWHYWETAADKKAASMYDGEGA